MAANQLVGLQALGFLPSGPGNTTSTLAMNATATWLAYQFVPSDSKTLNAVHAWVSAITGSPTAANSTCDLFSDASGVPNASIDGPHAASGAPAAGARLDFTGFNTALTAGTPYWLVFKTADAANFPTYRFGGSGTSPFQGGSNLTGWGWSKRHSTNSGTAWTAGNVASSCGWRLDFSDSTYAGLMLTAVSTLGLGYGAHEGGVKFTAPPGGILNVRGLAAFLQVNGAPTGNARLRLYTGSTSTPTLQATTASIPKGNIATAWFTAFFSSAVAVQPGTVCRITVGQDAGSDAIANSFGSYEYTIDNDANSLGLLPFEGTYQKTLTSDGTTFTDTTTALYPMALLLDSGGEFGNPTVVVGGNVTQYIVDPGY